MRILSLFDWIACGYEALQRAWIPIDVYYASEIDKYAIQIAKKNHPDIIEIWDVTQVRWEDYKDVDIIIGGSPCQWFSMAWKMLNFDDPRSKLFFEFVRLVKEIQPKYFLLENVKMKKEFRDKISEIMWCEPILIDSALVSAQHRERYYWTNIPWITQPEDRGILLKDILEENVDEKYYITEDQYNMIDKWKWFERPLENIKTWEDKMGTLTTHVAKMSNGIKLVELPCGTQLWNSKNFWNAYRSQKAYTLRACQPNGVIMPKEWEDRDIHRVGWLYGQTTRWWVYDTEWISPTITASAWMWWGHVPMVIIPKEWENLIDNVDGEIRVRQATKQWYIVAEEWDWLDLSYPTSTTRRGRVVKWKSNTLTAWHLNYVYNTVIRKLTPVECERLQTLPDGYTDGVSNSQRYKMLWNWWTCDVVAHIFRFIPK